MNTVLHTPVSNGKKQTLQARKVAIVGGNRTSHSGRWSEQRTAHALLPRGNGHARHGTNRSTNRIGTETRVSPAGRAGEAQDPANGNGGHMTKTHPAIEFRAMGEYENKELRAVKFRSDNEADRALVLIGKSPVLKRMPFLFANALTFIIPNTAIQTLKKLRLHFKVSNVLEMDDLDPEERAEIRRCQSL
jgi:hypothetical protein